ncbi:MAG: hypothetical protein IT192_02080 [Microbacteriaceae bacterium]|nr:hypothetical protein [Microbacteriaceae bacterium]
MIGVLLLVLIVSGAVIWLQVSSSNTSRSAKAEQAAASGYLEAAKVLQDGEVTPEEWKEMHSGWRGCMEQLGFQFDNALLDPINGLQYVESYEAPKEGVDPEAELACQQRYVDVVEETYLESAEPRMSSTLKAATSSCLLTKGIHTVGDEKQLADFMSEGGLSDSRRKVVERCVLQEVARLYPQYENPSLDPTDR